MNEGYNCNAIGKACVYARSTGFCGISACLFQNSTPNYHAIQGRFPNCTLCKKNNGVLNCNLICNGESAFEKIEYVTTTNATEQVVINATEPTITHSAGMEAEQEIKLIDIISRKSVEQWQFWDGAFFDDAEQKYLVNLLKSSRDALISQQVIR